MLDNKGSLYIIDAVLAIVLLLVVFLIINTAINVPGYEYSYDWYFHNVCRSNRFAEKRGNGNV